MNLWMCCRTWQYMKVRVCPQLPPVQTVSAQVLYFQKIRPWRLCVSHLGSSCHALSTRKPRGRAQAALISRDGGMVGSMRNFVEPPSSMEYPATLTHVGLHKDVRPRYSLMLTPRKNSHEGSVERHASKASASALTGFADAVQLGSSAVGLLHILQEAFPSWVLGRVTVMRHELHLNFSFGHSH